MKVAFVSSEIYPFAKTGGLADVAGALPKELEHFGNEVKVFMPKYRSVDETRFHLQYDRMIGEIPIKVGNKVRKVHVFTGFLPNSNVLAHFIDCPPYYHRDLIYTNDYDEDERFILFARGVIEAMQRLQWPPDIVHCNDWQSGLIPLMLKDTYSWDKVFEKTASVFTIHNIGYQGNFTPKVVELADLNTNLFYLGGPIEFHGNVSFLKTGLSYADVLNTVSNTYAEEILTEEHGAGMQDILKEKEEDLHGILNGVDYEIWDPAKDKFIQFNYSMSSLSTKNKNKKQLLEEFELPYNKKTPVLGIVSRLTQQKGFDLLAEIIPDLFTTDVQMVVLGRGEPEYEELFKRFMREYPDKISVKIEYDNRLAHLIEAGADMFLMPSHYEPCGLNQIYSLKYGTVPIVRKTGGLADTVIDYDEMLAAGRTSGTGFSFKEASGSEFLNAIMRALKYYAKKETWRRIQINGMSKDFSWKISAGKYMKLYERAVAKRAEGIITANSVLDEND